VSWVSLRANPAVTRRRSHGLAARSKPIETILIVIFGWPPRARISIDQARKPDEFANEERVVACLEFPQRLAEDSRDRSIELNAASAAA
jgi:hypothetical protein